MHARSWETMMEVREWNEAKPSASLAFECSTKFPSASITRSEAQIKHGPILSEHCLCHFIQCL